MIVHRCLQCGFARANRLADMVQADDIGAIHASWARRIVSTTYRSAARVRARLLHPAMRWWEAVNVPRRVLHVIEFGEGFTVVVLICEDLAQNDEVADLIRAIGPTGIVTPLLDGPQHHRAT